MRESGGEQAACTRARHRRHAYDIRRGVSSGIGVQAGDFGKAVNMHTRRMRDHAHSTQGKTLMVSRLPPPATR